MTPSQQPCEKTRVSQEVVDQAVQRALIDIIHELDEAEAFYYYIDQVFSGESKKKVL